MVLIFKLRTDREIEYTGNVPPFKSVVNLSVFSLRTRIPPATLVGKLMWAYIVAGQLLGEHFQYTLSPK
jgi:hypothetical protein